MRIAVVAGMLAAAVVPCATAFAQMNVPAPAERAGDETLEQKATEALQRMSKYLQSLHSFSVKANTMTDHVLGNGQKIQLDAALTMWFKRPDSLRVDLASDRRSRQLFYDGKHVTIYGRTSGYYARLAAPATLKELIGKLGDEYNFELPLADLFTWELTSAISRLSSAVAIGSAPVRGTACDQYAFRQNGLDWQIWIQRGSQPLPRRLVLTTTDDPSRPQYSVDLDWKVNERPAKSFFVFTPPVGSHEIPLRRADGTIAAREVQSVARTSVNPTTSASPSFTLGRHIDVDLDVDRTYRPWPTAPGAKTVTIATNAAVGSIVLSIPPSCQTMLVRGVTYSQCGNARYMPQIQGGSVVYVVMGPARVTR